MNINKRIQSQLKNKEKLTLEEAAIYMEVTPRTVLTYVSRYGLKRHFGRGTGVRGFYLRKEIDEWYRSEKVRFRLT